MRCGSTRSSKPRFKALSESKPDSGFLAALKALALAEVELVVVGVGGINFYARTPGDAVATLDLDAFLAPNAANLAKALRVLRQLGYRFESGDEPFVDDEDPVSLSRVAERGASLTALHSEAGQLDLMTSIAGFSYAELESDATSFSISDAEVRVGRLEKLLESKRASGRPKDLEFLRAYEAAAGASEEDGT